MAYGASRVDGVWRSSPDLAMPNSARHRRDSRHHASTYEVAVLPATPDVARERQTWAAAAPHQRASRSASPRTRRRSTNRRTRKKGRTPPNAQIQLRPRLKKTKRVVHKKISSSHAHERRDGGDLGRREHRRRGSSAAEPGRGIDGGHAHGPRLLQSCPRPVPHDCFALLRARLPSHPAALRRWRAACVECASMASTRSVAIRADEFRGCSCEIYELSL